jgi:hypothetical protein
LISVHVHKFLLDSAIALLFKVLIILIGSLALGCLCGCHTHIILQFLNNPNLGGSKCLVVGEVGQTARVLKLQVLAHVVLPFLVLHPVGGARAPGLNGPIVINVLVDAGCLKHFLLSFKVHANGMAPCPEVLGLLMGANVVLQIILVLAKHLRIYTRVH